MLKTDTWQGCYDSSWKGEIVPEAFSHPAKVARGLISQIYAHAFEQGWLKASDSVVDCFGGICGTGLDALWRGLNYTAVELEEKFVKLGEQNLALWNRKYGSKAGWGTGRIIQGDSRRLAEIIAGVNLELTGVNLICSSPPFSDSLNNKPSRQILAGSGGRMGESCKSEECYGSTSGNLGNMPMGEPPAMIVGSPPYESAISSDGSGIDWSKRRDGRTYSTDQRGEELAGRYGQTNGNIGNQSGPTFWTAAAEIVAQCHQVLRPGGHAIWIVKDFVRKGKRVPFSDQWQALCEAKGFTLVCRHRAMLVKNHGQQGLLEGGSKELKTERKSFFRRLCEKKGSPAIDHEDVICMKKTDSL